MSKLTSVGLMSIREDMGHRMDYCGAATEFEDINACTDKYLDVNGIRNDFTKDCTGKSSC